ncbi:MAG: hypothetical protein FWF76_02145, partial [Oscillospiraceae bacterium]|nr:hypothetical protein [Oscillospiraceae bacterium]
EATTTTEVTTTEPPVEPPETLSDEMRERIKADWVEMFDFANYYSFGVPKGNTNIENVVIDEYFGTFNDGVVLMISYDYESHSDNTWIGIISGFRFRFVSSQSIIVWFNGDFYGFTSAFENEILTKQNIEQIYFRHRKAFSNVYACDDFLDTEEYYKW